MRYLIIGLDLAAAAGVDKACAILRRIIPTLNYIELYRLALTYSELSELLVKLDPNVLNSWLSWLLAVNITTYYIPLYPLTV